MKLIATKSMRYGGKDLMPGDDFEASDRDGKLLKAIRKARDDDHAADEAAADVPDVPLTTHRPTYQTRRMKAKD